MVRKPSPEKLIINKLSPQFSGLLYWWPFLNVNGQGNLLYEAMRGQGLTFQGTDPADNWVVDPDRQCWTATVNDDTDEYWTGNDPPEIDSALELTFSGWVYPTDLSTPIILFAKNDAGALTTGFSFGWDSTDGWQVDFYDNGTNGEGHTGTGSYAADRWYHLTFVYNGSGSTDADKLKIYVDGVNISLTFTGTVPTAIPASGDNVFVGAVNASAQPDSLWKGRLDDFRLYSIPLSSGAVANMYNAQTRWELYQGPEIGWLALASGLGETFTETGAGGAVMGGTAYAPFQNDTATIGSASNRNYPTIQAFNDDLDNTQVWESGVNAVGECYNDSIFTENVTINGGTTIGLSSVTLTAATGHRHNGLTGSGVRIIPATGTAILLSRNNITVEWIEISQSGTANNNFGIGSSENRNNITIRHCIVHGINCHQPYQVASGIYLSHSGISNVDVHNCLVYNIDQPGGSPTNYANGIYLNGSTAGDTDCINCTVTGINVTPGSGGVGIAAEGRLQNCVVTNVGGNCFSSTDSPATESYNVSSDGTATGTGSITDVVHNDQYDATSPKSFHLGKGSAAFDAGTDLGNASSARYPFAWDGLVGAWGASLNGAEDGYDISGRGNNGTLNGGMGTIESEFGSVWDFDGSNDYVDLPLVATGELSGKSAVTVAAWVQRDSSGTRDSILDIPVTSTYSMVFMDFQANDTIRIGGRSQASDSFQSEVSTSTVTDNEWHHVLGVINLLTDDVLIYLDGVNQATTGSPSWGSNTFIPGSGTRNTIGIAAGLVNGFGGLINSLLIFDRVLSPEEVSNLYDITYDDHMAWAERRPLQFSYTAASDTTIGLVTETDTALAATAVKARTIGLVTETDTSIAISRRKSKLLGLASSTAAALALTVGGSTLFGQSVEVDTAQTITVVKTQALGQASESDVAQTLARTKARTLGAASESDIATTLPGGAIFMPYFYQSTIGA